MSKRKFSKKEVAISIAAAALAIATVGGAVAIHKDSSKKNIGLRYAVAGIMDGDVESLEDLLLVANKGQNPRATTEILDEYIDDPDTDINQLFEDTMGFLKSANATKKCVQNLEKTIEEEKAKK